MTNWLLHLAMKALVIDEYFDIKQKVDVGFPVKDIIIITESTAAACGVGSLAHLNFESGAYTRLLGTSSTANYVSLACIDKNTICAGSDDGRLSAIDFMSGAEIGFLDVGSTIRGIIPVGKRLIVYGGGWNSARSRSVVFVTVEQITSKQPAR